MYCFKYATKVYYDEYDFYIALYLGSLNAETRDFAHLGNFVCKTNLKSGLFEIITYDDRWLIRSEKYYVNEAREVLRSKKHYYFKFDRNANGRRKNRNVIKQDKGKGAYYKRIVKRTPKRQKTTPFPNWVEIALMPRKYSEEITQEVHDETRRGVEKFMERSDNGLGVSVMAARSRNGQLPKDKG